jgi:hypothetical protein
MTHNFVFFLIITGFKQKLMEVIQKHIFKGFKNKIKHIFQEHHQEKKTFVTDRQRSTPRQQGAEWHVNLLFLLLHPHPLLLHPHPLDTSTPHLNMMA